MIELLVQKFPERRRRLIARIILWGCTILSIALAVSLLLHLQSKAGHEKLFTDYFSAQESLKYLRNAIADSLHDTCKTDYHQSVMTGWNNAAVWLEKMQHYGDTLGIKVEYSIDSLSSIPAGIPSVKSMPVYFRIETDNRFDRILDFMKKLSNDSIAVRIDAVEMTGSAKGLADIRIAIITWIAL